jgi:hypothetical protein
MRHMAPITATSHTDRLPITDGRTTDARFIKQLRADLIEQCGGSPTASQRLLIDRIAILSLRIRLVDADPNLPDRIEYLDLTRLLADLLAQLGAPPAAPVGLRSQLREAAA